MTLHRCMLIFRLELSCASFCQSWRAASQRADVGKVSDGSCRSNFLGLGHLIISGAEFPLLPLGATLAVCQRVHLSPQSVTSASSSSLNTHISTRPPPFYLLLSARPPGLVPSLLCQEVVEAHLTSPWGDVLLFNTGFLHCHACTFADFRVCFLWLLEPFVTGGGALRSRDNS